MNMILHGINAPNIIHTNTLTENLADIQDKDRFDIVLANPPFGGSERKEVQQNFPIRTGETAFLPDDRAGGVRGDGARSVQGERLIWLPSRAPAQVDVIGSSGVGTPGPLGPSCIEAIAGGWRVESR
jgi:hypothetical protein